MPTENTLNARKVKTLEESKRELYPKHTAADLGNGAINAKGKVKSYFENEKEMLEAYKRAYESDLEFDRKVSEHKSGVAKTALATSELFAPLKKEEKKEPSSDEKFADEIKSIVKEQDDYLLGVVNQESFGQRVLSLTAELREFNEALAI